MATAQSASGTNIAQADNGSTAIINNFPSVQPHIFSAEEIAAAEAIIETLPVNILPEPAGLPPHSSMQWRRNRQFVGRKSELLTLAALLKTGGKASVGQSPAIIGLGGQGKTQLAVEFAYRFGKWFKGGVFWLNCGVPATIPEAMAAFAPIVCPTDAGLTMRPIAEQLEVVNSAFGSAIPRLLIFDNCEEEDILDKWAPKSGGCRLLLTSRRAAWSPARGITPMFLGALNRIESIELLLKHRPDLTQRSIDLNSISCELGDLPLAIELAGSFLRLLKHERSGDPSAYLAELKKCNPVTHPSLFSASPGSHATQASLTGHDLNVVRTFNISFQQLQAEDAEDKCAQWLFACTGWLASGEGIPRQLLHLCAIEDGTGRTTDHIFAIGLQRLVDFSLVMLEDDEHGGIVIHPLLAAFSRFFQGEGSNAWHVTKDVVRNFVCHQISQNNAAPLRSWEPHLFRIVMHARTEKTDTSFDLDNVLATYYTLIGRYDESLVLLKSMLQEVELSTGHSQSVLIATLANLGVVQAKLGQLSSAEQNLTRALTIKQSAVGPASPELVGLVINLSSLHYRAGNAIGAEDALMRWLGILTDSPVESKHLTAILLTNLGIYQRFQGKLQAAESNQRKALDLKLGLFSDDDPEVGIVRLNLGIVEREQGKLDEACRNLRQAAVIFESSYGPTHPEFARALSALGVVQHWLGEVDLAKKNLIRALAIRKNSLGPSHSDYATTLDMLGCLLTHLQEFSAAKICLVSAFKSRQRNLPVNRVDLGMSLRHLGEMYARQAQFALARSHFAAAWVEFSEALDPGHHYSVAVDAAMRQIDWY